MVNANKRWSLARPWPPPWASRQPDCHERRLTMMTAITLNLLAEEQLAQEARARDPIKLFIAIGLAALTLAVAWGGVLSAMLMQRRTELQGLDAQWKKMNAVGAGEGEFQAIGAAAEEITTLNRSRVLMAPQLALDR